MKYKYVALNPAQKTLAGTIDAKNEQDARAKLNKLSLAVLSIQELGDLASPTNENTRYTFEGRDHDNKKVVGTIAATSKLEALKRLSKEYELNVVSLFPPTATAEEQKQSFSEVKKLYEQIEKLDINKENNEANQDQLQQTNYQNKIQTKASEIIKQVETFLENFRTQLKGPEAEYIKTELIHLQRIRNTENVENLERSCEKLLKYIKEKEIFLEANQNLQEKSKIEFETQKLLSELKGIEHQAPLFNQSQKQNLKSKMSWWQQIKEAIFSSTPPSQRTAPELIELATKIKQTRQEIWNYIQLIIQTKKTQYRRHALKAIKPLFRKWWRLHQELGQKQDQMEGKIVFESSPFEKTLPLITASLLSIYLIIYFLFNFLTYKNFNITWPNFFYIQYTAILMYIIIAVFIIHLAVKAHIWLQKRQFPLPNLAYIVSFLVFGLIWLNL